MTSQVSSSSLEFLILCINDVGLRRPPLYFIPKGGANPLATGSLWAKSFSALSPLPVRGQKSTLTLVVMCCHFTSDQEIPTWIWQHLPHHTKSYYSGQAPEMFKATSLSLAPLWKCVFQVMLKDAVRGRCRWHIRNPVQYSYLP